MTSRRVMNSQERDAVYKKMMEAASNIIGFHSLGEVEDIARRPVEQLIYDAHVYANAIELALLLHQFNGSLHQED